MCTISTNHNVAKWISTVVIAFLQTSWATFNFLAKFRDRSLRSSFQHILVQSVVGVVAKNNKKEVQTVLQKKKAFQCLLLPMMNRWCYRTIDCIDCKSKFNRDNSFGREFWYCVPILVQCCGTWAAIFEITWPHADNRETYWVISKFHENLEEFAKLMNHVTSRFDLEKQFTSHLGPPNVGI